MPKKILKATLLVILVVCLLILASPRVEKPNTALGAYSDYQGGYSEEYTADHVDCQK